MNFFIQNSSYTTSEEVIRGRFNMKKLPVVFLLIISTVTMASPSNNKEYEVKSGFIKYEISGFDSGFTEIYFDNYGEKESVYSEISFKVNDAEMKTMIGTIKKSGVLYTLNFMSRTYFSENIQQPKKITKKKSSDALTNKVDEAFTELDMEADKITSEKKRNSQLIGQENVLGKICDVLRVSDGVIWVYKGIILRQIKFLNEDKIIYEAVIFEENTNITNEVFSVPEGFMVVENPMNKLFESSN